MITFNRLVQSTRKEALACLVITAILWSTGGLLIKLVDWHPLAIAGARSGISATVMYIYLKKHVYLKKQVYLKKPVVRLNKLKVLGAASYALLLILFVSANKLTSSANAILLQFTAPIWVALFSKWFLKERVRTVDWVAIAIIMVGMILFFVGDLSSGNLIGNVIAVASGVAMAAMTILLRLQDDGHPIEMILFGNVLTFLIGFPFFFISIPSLTSIGGLLLLGVFQLAIPYILYANAIRRVSALEAILIPIIEPLLNPVWVFLATGEAPGRFAIVGGLLVISALVSKPALSQVIDKTTLYCSKITRALS